MTTCYIDADIIAYRCSAASEDEEEGIAHFRVDDMMNNMLLKLQCEHYVGFLTGKSNFRKVLLPDYKANRLDKPKPRWLQSCRNKLQHDWNCTITHGIEADDALGIAASHELGSVICSIDKDLLQIPGDHYNFVKDEYQYVGGRSADLNFWCQLLVGDTSDNVLGIRGIGPVKARKALEPLKDLTEWFDKVREMYDDDARFLTNLNVLWVQRNKDKLWMHEHPDLTQMLPSELVAEEERKFSTHIVTLLSGSGTTDNDGTLPSGTKTEPTV
jgi:5'-3' exonuclease